MSFLRTQFLCLTMFVTACQFAGSFPTLVNGQENQSTADLNSLSVEEIVERTTSLSKEVQSLLRQSRFSEAIDVYQQHLELHKRYVELSDRGRNSSVCYGYEEVFGICVLADDVERAIKTARTRLAWCEEAMGAISHFAETARIELSIIERVAGMDQEDRRAFVAAYTSFFRAKQLVNLTFRKDTRYQKSLRTLLKAAREGFDRSLGDHNWFSLRCDYTGFVAMPDEIRQGDFEAHIKHLQELDISRFHPAILNAQISFGGWLAIEGQLETASHVLSQLIGDARESDDPNVDLVRLNFQFADIERLRGNRKESYVILQNLAESLPDKPLTDLIGEETLLFADVYSRLARAQESLGDIDGAIASLDIALECWLRTIQFQNQDFQGASEKWLRGSISRCELLSTRGDHARAVASARESLTDLEDYYEQDSIPYIATQLEWAQIFALAGEKELATRQVEDAMRKFARSTEKNAREKAAEFYLAAGNIKLSIDQPSQALELFQRSLEEVEKGNRPNNEKQATRRSIQETMAIAYLKNRDRENCFESLKKAMVGDVEGLVTTILEYDEAEAMVSASQLFDRTSIMMAAVDRQNEKQVAESLTRLLQTKALGAQILAERDRLIERLDSAGNDDLLEEYRSIRTEMAAAAYQSRVNPLSGDAKKLEEIEDRKKRFFASLPDDIKIALPTNSPDRLLFDLKERLKSNEAIVEFVANRRATGDAGRYQAFVIRKSQEETDKLLIDLINLGDVARIDELVETWRSQFVVLNQRGVDRRKKPEDVGVAAAGKALYEELWLPIAENLQGQDRIMIAGDGMVSLIPWSTLPTGEAGQTTNGTSVPARLIDSHQFVDLLSARFLLGKRAAAPISNDAAELIHVGIFADIDFGPVPDDAITTGKLSADLVGAAQRDSPGDAPTRVYWSNLGPANIEIGAVVDCFGEKQCEVFRKTDASRDNFFENANRFNVIHLATHGYSFSSSKNENDRPFFQSSNFFRRNPWSLCGLVFSNANLDSADSLAKSPVVSGEEVVARSFENVDLIVLSACSSGDGEVYDGEGSRGMQQACLLSGARSAVASYWPVNNAKTEEFMSLYYANLKSGQSVCDALHNAQKTFRDNGELMVHWGAWSIGGDPGVLVSGNR